MSDGFFHFVPAKKEKKGKNLLYHWSIGSLNIRPTSQLHALISDSNYYVANATFFFQELENRS